MMHLVLSFPCGYSFCIEFIICEIKFEIQKEKHISMHVYLFPFMSFIICFFLSASISSLFYDHAADEAAVGVHPGGNAKQGTFRLLITAIHHAFPPPHFCYSAEAIALTTSLLSPICVQGMDHVTMAEGQKKMKNLFKE